MAKKPDDSVDILQRFLAADSARAYPVLAMVVATDRCFIHTFLNQSATVSNFMPCSCSATGIGVIREQHFINFHTIVQLFAIVNSGDLPQSLLIKSSDLMLSIGEPPTR